MDETVRALRWRTLPWVDEGKADVPQVHGSTSLIVGKSP